MKQLTDAAFYNPQKKAEEKIDTEQFMSPEDLFDAIMRTAQGAPQIVEFSEDGPLVIVSFDDGSKLTYDTDGNRATLSKVSGEVIEYAGHDLSVDADQVEDPYLKAFMQHDFNRQAQMSPPLAPQPDMSVGQVPVQDKVQQYKDMGLNDQQVEQVMKISNDDGNNPAGTAASPMNGQRDSLSSEQIPGTGKIGQQDKSKPEDESGDEKPDAPEQYPDNEAPPEEETPKDVKKDLMGPEKSLDDKKKVIISFLGFVNVLHDKWTKAYNDLATLTTPYTGKGNPATKNDLKALASERKLLKSNLHSLQIQISKAGSMYKRLLTLLGNDMPKNELMSWLVDMQNIPGTDSMSEPMSLKQPAVIDPKQVRKIPRGESGIPKPELKPKSPVPTTPVKSGKKAQTAPPAGGPAVPPPPGAPTPEGIGMDPGLVEEKAEDSRSLEEVMEDLQADVEALTEKIQGGETIIDGQSLEPVSTDTGAEPAPAPLVAEKEAVDQSAKDYYQGYFGEYGKQLSEDRIAEVIDLVEETASDYGVVLTNTQVARVAKLVDGSEMNVDWANTLDRALINYMFKTGMIYHADALPDDDGFWRHMRATANSLLPEAIREKFATYQLHADKMKQPKVKGQPDDAVKVDGADDNAEDSEHELARPAYLKIELDDQEFSGAYLKLTLKWDADAPAADRSDAGLKQMCISFIKGLESKKEFIDYGFMGRPTFDEFDAEAGMAVISVRTQKPGDAPLSVKESD